MDIYLDNTNNYNSITLAKMSFIYNAINDGWKISKINNKKGETYIFKKKISDENKKEIFSNNFLETFINKNLNNL